MGGQSEHILLHMKYRCAPTSRLASVVAAAVLLLCTLADAHAAPPQMRGFRGLMWGDPPAHLGTAELVARDGNVQCYRRQRENLLFGDAALRSVLYCFHQDRLFLAVLDSTVDVATLSAEFEQGYGPPDTRTAVEVHWGDGTSAVSAEVVRPSASAPASLRLRAKAYAP
jgi:hypothetical protein